MKYPLIAIASILSLGASVAQAAPTRVGNGDDGADLEGGAPIASGPILEARDRAALLVRGLNTVGIPGLGLLEPEVATAPLVRAPGDVPAELAEDQGAFHAGMNGRVYARTLPEPHATTRFFPAAEELGREQLVALHVHEALHRALAPAAREDEARVASLTLAITAPGATHDSVRAAAERHLPEAARPSPGAASAPSPAGGSQAMIPETARVLSPSSVGYTFRTFRQPGGGDPNPESPLRAMHSIHSHLYPFGGDDAPFGIGIEASLLARREGGAASSEMGPLGLSARLRLWSGRGFDIGLWGAAALNTLSAEEIKASPYGRDVWSLGLSMRKDLRFAYFENLVGYAGKGEATQRVGLIDYTHRYGGLITASVRAGARLWKLKAGVLGEIYLSDYYRVKGGAFSFDSGRYRVVSFGPELGWESRDFAVAAFGRFLVSATRDANFDYLGNVMGPGVAQGQLGASLSFYF